MSEPISRMREGERSRMEGQGKRDSKTGRKRDSKQDGKTGGKRDSKQDGKTRRLKQNSKQDGKTRDRKSQITGIKNTRIAAEGITHTIHGRNE